MLAKLFLILLGCFTFGLGISLVCMALVYTVNQESVYAMIALLSGFGGIFYGIKICEDTKHG
jgi:ABC-type multidrug transport system permease subunit